jgi:hypothetical protein
VSGREHVTPNCVTQGKDRVTRAKACVTQVKDYVTQVKGKH